MEFNNPFASGSVTAPTDLPPEPATSTNPGAISSSAIAQVNGRPTTFITANTPADTLLSLSYIRSVLIRLEDTICFLLIERAQFAHNSKMYIPQAFPELVQKENWSGSWLTWFLKETESTHAKVRRWEAPDEWPYTASDLLPDPILPPIDYPYVLHQPAITLVHERILDFYQSHLVPGITARWGKDSDDGQYGSAAVVDVELLAALSRRIHFGMFVSESKFQSHPAAFIQHIRAQPGPNRAELEKLITKPSVEAALLVRLEQKASVYGQDLDLDRTAAPPKPRSRQGSKDHSATLSPRGSAAHSRRASKDMSAPGAELKLTAKIVAAGDPHPAAPPSAAKTGAAAGNSVQVPVPAPSSVTRPAASKIDVNEVVKLYHQFVIPITKDVEVEYLVKRLDELSEDEVNALNELEPDE